MHVFIIGSKGIPAEYGGFETFVDKLTASRQNVNIQYHVSCKSDEFGEFEYNNVRCFKVKTPNIGSAAALWYDILSLWTCYGYIKRHNLKDCIIYILASRIGPFLAIFKPKLRKHNIKIYVNPDGHEWSRSKWNKVIKWYWKFSERLMIIYSDLIVCDSKVIKSYIDKEYARFNKKTVFIPYGADNRSQTEEKPDQFNAWKAKFKIRDSYYLIVSRFVPENNYCLIIKEFIASAVDKELVIVSNVSDNKFYRDLLKKTNFSSNSSVKFIGTVYDQMLLTSIRQNAFAYLHGHEVGGTNPSLLEAMANTKLNLVYDISFNREVAEDAAVYFTKEEGSLTQLFHEVEVLTADRIKELGDLAKKRILDFYSWDEIIKQYELLYQNEFLNYKQISK